MEIKAAWRASHIKNFSLENLKTKNDSHPNECMPWLHSSLCAKKSLKYNKGLCLIRPSVSSLLHFAGVKSHFGKMMDLYWVFYPFLVSIYGDLNMTLIILKL